MSVTNFIPNGRTSRIKKGDASLQVHTEYAFRPYPRLTTTILTDGQVLHKIEKKLERPIESVEEQSEIERMIKRQHAEVLIIVEENSIEKPAMLKELKRTDSEYLTLADRIKAIPGVQRVYDLDNEGNFMRPDIADHFKKSYAVIYRGLKELVEIFAMIPGITMTREKGVYEVERDRLYLISCGDELCVVTVKRSNDEVVYESAIKSALEGFFRSA